jgi:hypothetical protein
MRLALIAGTLTRDAGMAAARRAAPLVLGIVVVASVLFSPLGMSARDAVSALAGLAPLRLGLFAAWTIAATPAARLLLETPSTFWLRALPAPRWHFLAVHGAHLLLLQAPWFWLHARGAGALPGAAAALSGAGAHAALIALLGQVTVGPLLALAALATAVAIGVPALALATLGAGALTIGVPAAFRQAPARAAGRRRPQVRGPAPVALALAHFHGAARAAPSALVRAAALALAGGALALLVARNNGLHGASLRALSLGVGAATLTVALGGLVEAVHLADRQAEWLLRATGTPPAVRVAATAAACALFGAGCGVLHGAMASDPWLVLEAGAWGAALGALASAAERVARAGGGQRMVGAAGVALAGAVTAGVLGEMAIAALAGAAAILNAAVAR